MIANFEDWQQAKRELFEETNALVECHECDGWGENTCDCCGNEAECSICDGEGKLPYSEAGSVQLTRKMYIQEVGDDLKDLCVFTGKDFLGVMGAFMKTEHAVHNGSKR